MSTSEPNLAILLGIWSPTAKGGWIHEATRLEVDGCEGYWEVFERSSDVVVDRNLYWASFATAQACMNAVDAWLAKRKTP